MQDEIFLVGSAILTVCLLPMVFKPDKPPLFTSWPAFVILTAYGFTFLSYSEPQYLAAGGMFTQAAVWGTLMMQEVCRRWLAYMATLVDSAPGTGGDYHMHGEKD